MARTAIGITTLTPNTAQTVPAGTTIDATNSHVLTIPRPATPGEVVINVTNTTASTKTVTLKAGASPPALLSGGGDIVLSLTDGSTTPTRGRIGPINAARFLQADGTINVDVAAGTTGTIEALYIPRA
jgi:hypothetical protein